MSPALRFTLGLWCAAGLLSGIPGLAQAPAAPAGKTFIDYFLPIPPRGPLSHEAWGAPAVLPRDPQNVLENGHVVAVTLSVLDVPKHEEKGSDRHGSKVIVIPFDGAALDRDLANLPELPSAPPAGRSP